VFLGNHYVDGELRGMSSRRARPSMKRA